MRTVVVLLLACLARSAACGEADLQFLEQLRARGLTVLAERLCEEQLARDGILPAEKIAWTVEISRARVDTAANLPAGARDNAWLSAEAVCAEALAVLADHPQGILLKTQYALVPLARGELLRMEADVTGSDRDFERARAALREAVSRLGKLIPETEAGVREANRRGASAEDDALSVEKWAALANNVTFQLARGYRNQALCYPPGSDDRTSALLRAVELLDPLTRLTDDSPVVWPATVDLLKCLRQLGRFQAAGQRLEQATKAGPPPEITPSLKAEALRLYLTAGQTDAARRLMEEPGGGSSAELDLAAVETLVALWQAAEKQERADETAAWQNKAAAAVRSIAGRRSPYWLRRAEAVIARAAGRGEGAGNVELLRRMAENHAARAEFAEAISAYEKAAAVAGAADDYHTRFAMLYRAAAVEHGRQRYDAAAQRFRAIALEEPNHPQAAEAHLLAVFDQSLWAREQETPDFTAYIALLEEHLNQWPASPTANQARWWLGQWRESRRQWLSAGQAYAAVTLADDRFEEATTVATRAYRRAFEHRPGGEQTADALQREAAILTAAQSFADVAPSADTAGGPRSWTPAQVTAVSAAAELLLSLSETHAGPANDWIAAATAAVESGVITDETARRELQSRLFTLLAWARLRQGDAAEAAQTLALAKQPPLEPLLGLAAEAARWSAESAPSRATREELAALSATIEKRLARHAAALTDEQRVAVEVLRSRALLAAGETEAAIARLRPLAENRRNDAAIQQLYGDALLAGGAKEHAAAALAQWRLIQKRSPPQSARWFTARLNVAKALRRSGQPDTAAALIRYTQALYPELGGETRNREFLQLLRNCEEPPRFTPGNAGG